MPQRPHLLLGEPPVEGGDRRGVCARSTAIARATTPSIYALGSALSSRQAAPGGFGDGGGLAVEVGVAGVA